MYSSVTTAILRGITSTIVTVEADVSSGMPYFEMVGFLSAEVKEAKERVRTALKNCGFVLPPKRITVNIAPASIKKQGCGFDLPLAIAILKAMSVINDRGDDSGSNRSNYSGNNRSNDGCNNIRDDKIMMIGELGLSGQINSVTGVLPILLDAVNNGIEECIVPYENYGEAKLAKGIRIIPVKHLLNVIDYMNDGVIPIVEDTSIPPEEYISDDKYDFANINGQKVLRRACEIAVSGMHNFLMIGPPGAGKTLIAKSLPSILPPMTEEECIVSSKIASVSGHFKDNPRLINVRPFRSPHHTISPQGLIGGGMIPKPGEISLAHNGVLFLDELTEFHKSTLEMLRQPMEDNEIHIARAYGTYTYPCNFMLVCAMNPCSCGYYPDLNRCRCDRNSIRRYYNKLSQPLLDRIDMCSEASMVKYRDIVATENNESSEVIRNRVIKVHDIQKRRFQNKPYNYNSDIPSSEVADVCGLTGNENKFMESIYEKCELTGRTYYKMLRVARTIADMAGEDKVGIIHLKEALIYRGLDKKYIDKKF
ncbi:MAG: YifB family Mg chelatase-like AAA ATPase [Lachnospiraceae bacterium]|nr:YifB family Mg chelatase-like AAA ATPase [Lachnospiraceae bacterium]